MTEDGRRPIGSKASWSASPSNVHATTTRTSATPGAAATHGALTSVSRPDAIMLPHDGVGGWTPTPRNDSRSEEHTSELQSQSNLVCRLLLEKKKTNNLT